MLQDSHSSFAKGRNLAGISLLPLRFQLALRLNGLPRQAFGRFWTTALRRHRKEAVSCLAGTQRPEISFFQPAPQTLFPSPQRRRPTLALAPPPLVNSDLTPAPDVALLSFTNKSHLFRCARTHADNATTSPPSSASSKFICRAWRVVGKNLHCQNNSFKCLPCSEAGPSVALARAACPPSQ